MDRPDQGAGDGGDRVAVGADRRGGGDRLGRVGELERAPQRQGESRVAWGQSPVRLPRRQRGHPRGESDLQARPDLVVTDRRHDSGDEVSGAASIALHEPQRYPGQRRRRGSGPP